MEHDSYPLLATEGCHVEGNEEHSLIKVASRENVLVVRVCDLVRSSSALYS